MKDNQEEVSNKETSTENNAEGSNETVENLNQSARREMSKEEGLKLLGLTEERTLELKEIMIQVTDSLKQKKLPINVPSLVNESADRISNTREALFIGIIFGESIASLRASRVNPLEMLAQLYAASKE